MGILSSAARLELFLLAGCSLYCGGGVIPREGVCVPGTPGCEPFECNIDLDCNDQKKRCEEHRCVASCDSPLARLSCDGGKKCWSCDEFGEISCSAPLKTYYRDSDGDGFGDSHSTQACGPDGVYQSQVATDCDDADRHANSSQAEICDDIDNNCDGYRNDWGSECLSPVQVQTQRILLTAASPSARVSLRAPSPTDRCVSLISWERFFEDDDGMSATHDDGYCVFSGTTEQSLQNPGEFAFNFQMDKCAAPGPRVTEDQEAAVIGRAVLICAPLESGVMLGSASAVAGGMNTTNNPVRTEPVCTDASSGSLPVLPEDSLFLCGLSSLGTPASMDRDMRAWCVAKQWPGRELQAQVCTEFCGPESRASAEFYGLALGRDVGWEPVEVELGYPVGDVAIVNHVPDRRYGDSHEAIVLLNDVDTTGTDLPGGAKDFGHFDARCAHTESLVSCRLQLFPSKAESGNDVRRMKATILFLDGAFSAATASDQGRGR